MIGAMTFAERRPARRPEPILPMVNLVFLLLVFFIMAAIIAPRPAVAVREPAAAKPGSFEPASLRVAIGRDGTVHFGTATDAAALAGLATEFDAPAGPPPVAIHADRAAPAVAVVRLVAELAQMSAGPVWLVTEPAE